MTNDETTLELITYELLPSPAKGEPIGIAYFKIQNGLTTHFASDFFHKFQLSDDGTPNIYLQQALGNIDYNLTSEVSTAISKLRELGYLRPKTTVTSKGLAEWDFDLDVEVTDWTEDKDNSQSMDLSFHLEDIEDGLVRQGKAFSEEWFYARICKMYFSGLDSSINLILNIGILVAQLQWKTQHEQAAIDFYSNEDELLQTAKRRKTGSLNTHKKAANQKELCRFLICELIYEAGTTFYLLDNAQMAKKVRGIADSKYPEEFEFQKNKLRPEKWFLNQIEDMKASGEFKYLVDEVIKKKKG